MKGEKKEGLISKEVRKRAKYMKHCHVMAAKKQRFIRYYENYNEYFNRLIKMEEKIICPFSFSKRKNRMRTISDLWLCLPFLKGKSVLDIGTRDFYILNALKYNNKKWKVKGIDVSWKQQRFYSAYYRIPFQFADINLNMINETFDFIICRHVIEHTYSPRDVLMNIYGMLKEEGIVLLEVPSKERMKKGCLQKAHSWAWTAEGFKKLCERYFECVQFFIISDDIVFIGRRKEL